MTHPTALMRAPVTVVASMDDGDVQPDLGIELQEHRAPSPGGQLLLRLAHEAGVDEDLRYFTMEEELIVSAVASLLRVIIF